jgi:hypothetical protein
VCVCVCVFFSHLYSFFSCSHLKQQVNGRKCIAFVDSGAQSTIMSSACAERVHIYIYICSVCVCDCLFVIVGPAMQCNHSLSFSLSLSISLVGWLYKVGYFAVGG